MTNKTLNSKPFKDQMSDFVKQRKYFIKDPTLQNYSRSELKDYIKFCCEHQYLIEAYSLVLQYVEEKKLFIWQFGNMDE